MDRLTREQRSALMSRIRSVSRMELRARRLATERAGCRLRHGKSGLPGRPDYWNKSRQTVVFVHGCFWHGCRLHFRMPGTNAEFWAEKIDRNRTRDALVRSAYVLKDWKFFEIWEHDV